MKYLWLTFFVCVIGLILQVKLADPPDNPFASGALACLPVPPARVRADPPLLPAPVLTYIPPLASPIQVQATSIEIFDPSASTGLMVETRQADNMDWGLPRSLPADIPTPLAYAVEARLVEPVPVNVPPSVATVPPELTDIVGRHGKAWHPMLEKWQDGTNLLEMAMKLTPATPTPEPDISAQNAVTLSEVVVKDVMAFYPAPEPEPLEVASLGPQRVVTAPQPHPFTPNLYLPEGALDEEGAKLTLIRPDLRIYELPDESSAAAPEVLKSGDEVRPLTRLRNAEGYDWIKISSGGRSWWAQAEYFIRVDPRNRRQYPKGNLEFGKEEVDRDSALPVDYQPDDLKDIAGEYTFGAKNVQLRSEATEGFERMAAAAKKDGLQIRVFSGFRDFAYQKRLYLDAVNKNGPKQDGTAAPGYSEHQLGTTADICNDNRRTILSGTFGDTPEGRWLHENSERFGFRKSYTQENSEQVGYKPEPWHFRYIGIAQKSGSRNIAGR